MNLLFFEDGYRWRIQTTFVFHFLGILSMCLMAFRFAAPNHGYFANCSLSELWTKTQTTCWTDLCRHSLIGLPRDVLMSWITCWMSIVMSLWKLKTRSLPGLIKQPARSPLLTSSRFKGKAPLSTTCLHIISDHFDMQSSVSMWKSCLCEESITWLSNCICRGYALSDGNAN